MKLTYIQQSGSPPVGDGGDQYTGLDRFGRVIDQRWIKDSSGADLERVEYGFDRASNRVWRNNTVADALTAKQDEFYTYDGLNQLLTLQRGTLNSGKTGISGTPAWEEDFTIDPTGNWNNYVNQVNGTTTINQPRTHNAVNEVETVSGSSSLIEQNAAGNMSKAPKPTDWSSAYTMTYDAWQRLVKVRSGSTTVAIYAYDGQDRRVTKTIGATTRHYYYTNQWQILEERLNATTTADRQFVWGLMGADNLILRDRGSERCYSLQDVFSCTAIADTTGTIQERYGYNAFGLSRVMTATFTARSTSSYDWETRYDNYRFDEESNYYQARYRYFHPALGRWITRDLVEYLDGTNIYQYVKNSPTNLIDSFGSDTFNIVGKSFINGPGPIGRLGWRFGLVVPGLPLAGYPWFADLRLKLFVKLLVKYVTPGPFNQNPTNDAKDGKYRLYAQRTVEINCNGNKIGSYVETGSDQDGGVEFSILGYNLVVGTINSTSKFLNKNSKSVQYELFTWGRPNSLAEIGMQWVALRTSRNIWHKAEITFNCVNGKVCYSLDSFDGSCYPSRRLWINGSEIANVAQGTLSSLWNAESGKPSFVAPCS